MRTNAGTRQASTRHTYNAAGQVEVVALENGTSVQMTYDATYGRLASLTNRAAGGSVMTSFAYTYNLDGYVTEVEREESSTITYQYDGVGRLIDEQRDGSGTSYHNHFEYDPVGNRVSWLRADESFEGEQTHAYLYNGLNQLVSHTSTGGQGGSTELYAYDLNGNLTEKAVYSGVGEEMSLSETWLYEWDSEDRLVKVIKKNGSGTVLLTVEYAYCPACGGNRTQKRVWNGTKTDQTLVKWLQYETEGLNQLRVDEKWESETDGNNYLDALDPWRTQRVSFNGPGQIQQLLKEVIYNYPSSTTNTVSSQTTIYYGYDRMGVVAGLSNAAGAELQQFESDAFGSWDGLNTYTTRRITGKEYDEDTGLYFFQARWYQPETGRMLSVDLLEGSPFVNYVLVGSSPTMQFDASGWQPKALRRTCTQAEIDEQLNGLQKALENAVKEINAKHFGERPLGCGAWADELVSAGNNWLHDNRPSDVIFPCWEGRKAKGCGLPLRAWHQVSEWRPNCTGKELWESPKNVVFDAWSLRSDADRKGSLQRYTMRIFRSKYFWVCHPE